MIRRYARWLFGTTAILLAVVAGVNCAVDPLNVYRWPWSARLAPYKPRDIDRVSKAETARRIPLDAVILGDSRVLRGFDPRHPALAGFGRSFNLGVSAASIYEATQMLNLCLDRHPPKLAIWSLAPELVETDRRERTSFDFELSRLNPKLNLVTYHAHNAWGRDVLRASQKVLKLWWRGRSTSVVDGFEPDRHVDDDPHGLFLRWLPAPGPPGPPASDHAAEATLQLIARSLERADALGTRVIVVFPPVHAAYLEGLAQLGQWDAYERGKRRIVEIVDARNRLASPETKTVVWDFSGFHGLTAEPPPKPGDAAPMTWYLDPLHFRESLGGIVMDRMFGLTNEHDDFGVVLTTENVDAHLASQRDDRERYRREASDVVRLASEQARSVR